MEKEEIIERLENLEESKRIRFNLGKIDNSIYKTSFFLSGIIFFGFTLLFLSLGKIYLGYFFGCFTILFFIIEFFLMYQENQLDEKFLKKYSYT